MKGLYAWDIAGGLTLVRGSDGLASDFHGNAFINMHKRKVKRSFENWQEALTAQEELDEFIEEFNNLTNPFTKNNNWSYLELVVSNRDDRSALNQLLLLLPHC